jgi:hypothetical protein
VQARDALPWPTIAADVAALAHTSDALKPRIALVAALINGAAPAADPGSAQAEIDAMFGP